MLDGCQGEGPNREYHRHRLQWRRGASGVCDALSGHPCYIWAVLFFADNNTRPVLSPRPPLANCLMGNVACCCSEPINFDGDVDLYHFNLHRAVGKGAFGKVRLPAHLAFRLVSSPSHTQVRVVEHKKSKKLYALKYMEKAKCIKQKAVANIIQERRLLEEVRPSLSARLPGGSSPFRIPTTCACSGDPWDPLSLAATPARSLCFTWRTQWSGRSIMT